MAETFAILAYRNMKQYRARVARLPRKPITLRCPNGHEWATTYTDPTPTTYPHYDKAFCPVCDDYYTSGQVTPEQRMTDAEIEAQIDALCAANPYM